MNDIEFEKIMDIITSAILEVGYDVQEQLTGYLMTGDPTYITRRNNARILIKSVDQEQLRNYIDRVSTVQQ